MLTIKTLQRILNGKATSKFQRISFNGRYIANNYSHFFRSVLFLSVLFTIIGRLFILVLFAYSFGPGNYFPLLIFIGAHILLMSALHFVFSDAKKYWQKGGFLNLSFFHYLIGNGLANIYIHNWIRYVHIYSHSWDMGHIRLKNTNSFPLH